MKRGSGSAQFYGSWCLHEAQDMDLPSLLQNLLLPALGCGILYKSRKGGN